MGPFSRGVDVAVYVWHIPTELAHSFLFCSCVYFCLYGLFNCISFHQFSRQLSVFSLCSPGLMSALLVLSTLYLFMKISFSPDIIPRGWLGSKHQLSNWLLCLPPTLFWHTTYFGKLKGRWRVMRNWRLSSDTRTRSKTFEFQHWHKHIHTESSSEV